MPGTTLTQSFPYPYMDEMVSDVSTKNLADAFASELTTVQDVNRLKALKRPVAKASRILSTQNFADGVNTIVTFDTESYDSDGFINLGTNANRIIIPSSSFTGIYYAVARCESTGGGSWNVGEITINKNGGIWARRKYFGGSGSAPDVMLCKGLVYMGAASDFFEMTMTHSGGGTTAAIFMSLTVHRVTS